MDREDVINRPFDENDIEGFIDGATAHLDITPVNPVTVVAEALTAFVDAALLEQVAKHVLSELGKAGVVVMAPQDIEWGHCPDNGSEPHRVSLDMCVFCLQYNPD
jgi:hypothetical protein